MEGKQTQLSTNIFHISVKRTPLMERRFSLPFFLYFQANTVRGVIAALVCFAVFAIFAVVSRFVKRKESDETAVRYEANGDNLEMRANNGRDNPALDRNE